MSQSEKIKIIHVKDLVPGHLESISIDGNKDDGNYYCLIIINP